jgi:hypothetical protein
LTTFAVPRPRQKIALELYDCAVGNGSPGSVLGLSSPEAEEKLLVTAAKKIAWCQRRNAVPRKTVSSVPGFPFSYRAGNFGLMNEFTRILNAVAQGEPQAAEELLPLVYGELRKLATTWLAHEKPGQTISAQEHAKLTAACAEVGRMLGSMIQNPEPFILSDFRALTPDWRF